MASFRPGEGTVRKGFMEAMPLNSWIGISLVAKGALNEEASWIEGWKEDQMQCILGTATATASSARITTTKTASMTFWANIKCQARAKCLHSLISNSYNAIKEILLSWFYSWGKNRQFIMLHGDFPLNMANFQLIPTDLSTSFITHVTFGPRLIFSFHLVTSDSFLQLQWGHEKQTPSTLAEVKH